MGTFSWPPTGTWNWPHPGTFPWPRKSPPSTWHSWLTHAAAPGTAGLPGPASSRCGFLPAWPAPGLVPQRLLPGRRRLVQTLTRRWPGEVPRRLGQPGLQLGDPLLCPRQLRSRLRQLRAQGHYQRRQHLIWRQALISGHVRTLRVKDHQMHAFDHHRRAGVATRQTTASAAWPWGRR